MSAECGISPIVMPAFATNNVEAPFTELALKIWVLIPDLLTVAVKIKFQPFLCIHVLWFCSHLALPSTTAVLMAIAKC